MRVAAIVVAAGRGERLGQELPKAYVRVAGRTLLGHAVAALARCDQVDVIVPVLPADLGVPDDAVSAKSRPPVAGGLRRQDSVAAGLAALPDDVEWVAVHDAARALIRPEAIDRVIAAAKRYDAALLALPVADTLKRVKDGRVVETPSRAEFWVAQTPQVFRVSLLRRALAAATSEATDCAQLVAAIGAPVHVVEGDRENLKITYEDDLRVAEYLLGERAR